jgi:hypothetical protein
VHRQPVYLIGMDQPLTPCRNICVIDPQTGYCIGCGRTGEEIAAWPGLPDADRRAIMDRLPERLLRLTAERPRRGGREVRRVLANRARE